MLQKIPYVDFIQTVVDLVENKNKQYGMLEKGIFGCLSFVKRKK